MNAGSMKLTMKSNLVKIAENSQNKSTIYRVFNLLQVLAMNKWLSYLFLSFFICIAAALQAESQLIDIPAGELLDAYLEDESAQSRKPLKRPELAEPNPVDLTANSEPVEFRKVSDQKGVQVFEVVPATPAATSELADNEQSEGQQGEDFEVIELESYNEDIEEVEAPVSENAQVVANTNEEHLFCRQNPLAKECLYAPYLSRCGKDPQSLKCQTQLEKFESFCETFPRAYKCKKAQLAATCKQQPELNQCKPFTERYCLKHPNAIFCDWN